MPSLPSCLSKSTRRARVSTKANGATRLSSSPASGGHPAYPFNAMERVTSPFRSVTKLTVTILCMSDGRSDSFNVRLPDSMCLEFRRHHVEGNSVRTLHHRQLHARLDHHDLARNRLRMALFAAMIGTAGKDVQPATVSVASTFVSYTVSPPATYSNSLRTKDAYCIRPRVASTRSASGLRRTCSRHTSETQEPKESRGACRRTPKHPGCYPPAA
jgi:hypothetical protein